VPSTRATTTRPTDRELDPDAIQWVEATLAGMDDTRRLRALFALAAFSDSPAELDELARHQPGAVMLAGAADATATRRAVERLQAGQSLPLLIAGDIEGGLWNPAGLSATPSPLALAAADDPALTAALAAAAARQARAAGYNWTFAPVLDLNVAWRSAIVGTRSYGADAGRVLAHARAYVQGMQSEGVACTAKHWPGEGQDERDQHLLTTWNPQSMGEWDSSHGNLYRGLIEAGVMGVMAGHIAFPAGCDDHPALAAHPASVNPALNQGLLRKRMGFTGLLVSDATLMAGLAGQMPRDELVTAVIAGGCDMLLFSLDPAADLRALQQALAEGRLTTRRVEEAVRRQLEMKARLGLHRTTPAPATLQDINHLDELVDRACAQAVTLVRDAGVLPLSPARHRRIAVYEQAGKPMLPGMVAPTITALMAALRDRGFEPFHAAPNQPLDLTRCDLVLYVVTQESAPTLGRTGLDWTALQGDFPWSMQRHWHVVPAVLVSFGHPYLLIDAPQVPVYVNAYSALAPMQRAVVAALTGAAPFTGRNPVDPFCGLPQAAFTAISPLPKQARTAARSPA
jgi:beta-N-acetylhexosaminidase